MNITKEDYNKLEKAIDLLKSISKDITTTNDMDVIITQADNVILSLDKRTKPYILDKRHVDYLNKVRAELISAEKIIDDIKNSTEWKKVINYFNSYYTRGKLKVKPTKENEYTYQINDGYHNQKPLKEEYVDYLNKTKVELIKAEEAANKIKSSDEWKRCRDYFILCEHRNLLECRPSKQNGYTVKVKDFSE